MHSLHGMPVLRCRLVCWTILLAVLLLTPTTVNPQWNGALARGESERGEIHVAIERGLLSVDVHNAPLADVLRAIAEKAHFRLTLRGDLSTSVTWKFTGVPLDKGIKWLVGNNSVVMVHAPPNGANLFSEVRVRGSGRGIC